MKISTNIFRDYDIRAVIPQELDYDGIERLMKATAFYFKPKVVAIGYDARLTGPKIQKLSLKAFQDQGIDVVDLGQITTDMMTFSAGKYNYDLAIIVTASHNPSEYNGFKMAIKGGTSVSGETGFYSIRDLAQTKKIFPDNQKKGKLIKKDIYQEWIDFCFSLSDYKKIKPLKVVIDTGNGIAGKVFGNKLITQKIPIKIIPLYFDPDGHFPNHVPNPLVMDNLKSLIERVKKEKADLGVAVDGDGDRIAFVTEKGEFVSGTITTAIIAKNLLKKYPGETVLYNAVCGRIATETIKSAGGKPQRVRVGYSLIKQQMDKTKAIFAGEHSCHYFYKNVYNSESTLLTFLLILEFLSEQNKPFSEIFSLYNKYFVSGEINFEVKNKTKIMEKIAQEYQNKADKLDWLDGVSIWFKSWWANVRPSNTQPLLRLNVEADNLQLLKQKEQEFIKLITAWGGKRFTD